MKILNRIFNKVSIAALAVMAVVGFSLTSCQDDDKNNLDDFIDTAGFVRFAQVNPPSTLGVDDVSDISYAFDVIDGNGNVTMYDLDLYANLSGTITDTVDVQDVTSFPASFAFNAEDLASLLGVTVADLNFGDQFFFTATVTTDEGLEYSGSTRLDLIEVILENGVYLDVSTLDDDGGPDEVIVGPDDRIYSTPDGTLFVARGGDVTDDLLDEAGYLQAFEFGFIVLCPVVDFDALVGTYNVENHFFDIFFGTQPPTRTVVAGPGPDQITILGGAIPLDNPDDLVLTINASSSVSFGGENDDVHFNTFGPATYDNVDGLVFSCIGRIDIAITSTNFISNFLTLQKSE